MQPMTARMARGSPLEVTWDLKPKMSLPGREGKKQTGKQTGQGRRKEKMTLVLGVRG